MRNRWRDEDAADAVARWGGAHGEAVALRTYTSRLIGADPGLVLHGGGNTSVKGEATDVLGEPRPALFVKGSGWDLASLEPAGLPAVDLDWVRRLRALDALSDEAMVNALRTHLFDATAPNPSIETLLHAFLPHAFVDHSHADAILAVTNTTGGEDLVREALGEDVALVPYVKAGFDLAKLAADVHDANPGAIGMVLMHHGLFTWGDTAKQSYERHIEVVSRAERFLGKSMSRATLAPPGRVDTEGQARHRTARLLPILRGALADGDGHWNRWILDWRGGDEVLASLSDRRLAEHAATGPLTPDHVIRTKPRPLVLELDPDEDPASWRESVEDAVRAFRRSYRGYFETCATAADGLEAYTRLDDTPRVVWAPGFGLFGVGASPKASRVAADIAEHTLHAKLQSACAGPWKGLDDHQLFEMEYWSLEQAKLKKAGGAPTLGRRVALITGGAGAIGVGVARELLAEGACVVLLDLDRGLLERAVEALGGERESLLTVSADVTDPDQVARAFEAAVLRWGGVDLVVVNAGIAAVGTLDRMQLEDFDRVVAVNLRGAWNTLAEASRVLKAQGTGGGIVVVSTKNVAAPGASFGAYSASKAGAHQLGRVAALELAEHGVRVNLVAPDAVFADGEIPSGLWETVGPDRARSRGMDPADLPDFYRQRNLLGAAVEARHVGRAVVFFASEQTPTTGAVLPVDGGLPTTFSR